MDLKAKEEWGDLVTRCSVLATHQETDKLIQQVCQLIHEQKHGTLSLGKVATIVTMIRETLCPHTTKRTHSKMWDYNMSYLIIYCILPCNLSDAWTRSIRSIIHNDLNLTAPYDGSQGLVHHLLQIIRRLYTAISLNDKITLKNILHNTEGHHPVLHLIDESKWTLLHHAAYHSVPHIIEILHSAGLSLNEVTVKGETPLHIAAASLRHESIQILRHLGAKLLPMRPPRGQGEMNKGEEEDGMTPLQTFLNTLRYCNWTKRLSPHHLLHCLRLLSEHEFDLWNSSTQQLFPSSFSLRGDSSLELNLPPPSSVGGSTSLSLFTIALAYTDITISSEIIRTAKTSFQLLRESISTLEGEISSPLSSSALQSRLKLFEYLLLVIQHTVLLLVQKRKSRVLKLLLESFWDYLCLGATDTLLTLISPSIRFISPFRSHFASPLPPRHDPTLSLNDPPHDSMKMALEFWSQCLFSATASKSLRIVGLLMNPFITSIHSLFFHFIRDLHLKHVTPNLDCEENQHLEIPSSLLSRYKEILSYLSLKAPFLLLPILQADTSMLIYLMDMCVGSALMPERSEEITEFHLYQSHLYHCLLTTWVTTPSGVQLTTLPSLCIPSLPSHLFNSPLSHESSPSPSHFLSSFLQWCQQRDTQRTLSSLSELASQAMSPLATACLTGNTYVLQLLLQRCIFSSTYPSSSHRPNGLDPLLLDRSSELFQMGVNPLCACLFSGSAGTMRCLLHCLGNDLFTQLCNHHSSSACLITPLQLLLTIINIKRKRSFLMNSTLRGTSTLHTTPGTLYSQVIACYLETEYLHPSDPKEMLGILLPRTDLKSLQCSLSNDILETQFFSQRTQELISCSSSPHLPSLTPSVSLRLSQHELISSAWTHLTSLLASVSFITKLKITLRNILPETKMEDSIGTYCLGTALTELKTHRQYTNIIHAVIAVLRSRDKSKALEQQADHLSRYAPTQGDGRRGGSDWWKLFQDYVSDDYTLPLKSPHTSSLRHLSSSTATATTSNSKGSCSKIVMILLDCKDLSPLPLEVQDELVALLPTSPHATERDASSEPACLIPLEDLFNTSFQQLFCQDMLQRKTNNILELHAVCEVIDILYKWLILLLHQSRFHSLTTSESIHSETHFTSLESTRLEEIISMNQLLTQEVSLPSCLLHLLVGDYPIPIEVHLTTCLLRSFHSENMLTGYLSTENQFPCLYNNWTTDTSHDESESEMTPRDEGDDVDNESTDPWKARGGHRGLFLHKQWDHTTLIDEMSKRIIEFFSSSEWEQSLSHHPQGMPLVMCLCLYDCWSAAHSLLEKLFHPPPQLSHRQEEEIEKGRHRYNQSCKLLIPGGLRSVTLLSEATTVTSSSYSSLLYLHHRQALVYNHLHYSAASCLDPTTAAGPSGLRYCDLFTIAIAKRANSFILSLLPSLLHLIDGLEELMQLAYVLDNSLLCVQLGWFCLGNQPHHQSSFPRRSNQIIFFLPLGVHEEVVRSSSLMNFIPSPMSSCLHWGDSNISAERWNERRLTGYHLNRSQWNRFLRQHSHSTNTPHLTSARLNPELLARTMLGITLQNLRENARLAQRYLNSPVSSDRNKTPIQLYQQTILERYGFHPQHSGEFSGLCLSNDQSVWLMNGSLISQSEFFSSLRYLHRVLPCPSSIGGQNISTTYSSTQHTALHSLVQRFFYPLGDGGGQNFSPRSLRSFIQQRRFTNPLISEMDQSLFETICLGWAQCGALKTYREWRFESCRLDSSVTAPLSLRTVTPLHVDVAGQSSVSLSIGSHAIDLSISLLKMSSSLSSEGESRLPQLPAPPCGGRIAQKYITQSVEQVMKLEESLYQRLQGSYVGDCHGSLIFTLITYLDRIEMLFKYLVTDCDMSAYTRMVYDPVGGMIDCLQKSKACLFLLNIPYSSLTPPTPALAVGARDKRNRLQLMDENLKKTDQENILLNHALEDGEEASQTDHDPQQEVQGAISSSPYQNLTPQKLKEMISWDLMREVQALLSEWVEEKIQAEEYLRLSSPHSTTGVATVAAPTSMRRLVLQRREVEEKAKMKFGSFSYSKLSTTLRLTHLSDQSLTEYLPTPSYSPIAVPVSTHSTRDHRQPDSYLWESHIPPFLLAETRLYRKQQQAHSSSSASSEMISTLSKLLLLTKQNPSLVQSSLKTAIVLLEFVRTLCNARLLVSLTTEMPLQESLSHTHSSIDLISPSLPSQRLPQLASKAKSTTSHQPPNLYQSGTLTLHHPLDQARREIKLAREYSQSISQFFKRFGSSGEEMERGVYDEYLSSGAETRIQLLDSVALPQLTLFFELAPELSPTFSSLRNIILSSIYLLFKIKDSFSHSPLPHGRMGKLLAALKNFIMRSRYNEEDILFGGGVGRGEDEDDLSFASLGEGQSEEDDMNSDQLDWTPVCLASLVSDLHESLTQFKINDIAFETLPSGVPTEKEPSQGHLQASFNDHLMSLYHHLLRHKEIFQTLPLIPFRPPSSAHSSSSVPPSWTPITECPSRAEIEDIVSVFSFTLSAHSQNQDQDQGLNTYSPTGVSRERQGEIKSILRSLRAAYVLSSTLIEFIITVIGLHALSDVFITSDPACWKSRGQRTSDPLVSLCYAPLMTLSRPNGGGLVWEYLFQRVKHEQATHTSYTLAEYGLEFQTIEAFDELIAHDKGGAVTQLLLPLHPHPPVDHQIFFSSFSQLEYLVFLSALFGRPALLQRTLHLRQTPARKRQEDGEMGERRHDPLHLFWCVAVVAPPLSPLGIQPSPSSSPNNALGLTLSLLSPHGRYESVLLQLLQEGYKPTQPPHSRLPLLDLLTLKRYHRVVALLLQDPERSSLQRWSLSHFGSLHFMLLDPHLPATLLHSLLLHATHSLDCEVGIEMTIVGFMKALLREIRSVGKVVKEIMRNIPDHNPFLLLSLDSSRSLGEGKETIDFMNEEILRQRSGWSPIRLLVLTMRSLRTFHQRHSSSRSIASLDSPLEAFLLTIEERLTLFCDQTSSEKEEEDVPPLPVMSSSLCWSVLTLAIAATSTGNRDSLLKFHSVWALWREQKMERLAGVSTDTGGFLGPPELLHVLCFYGLSEGVSLYWKELQSSRTSSSSSPSLPNPFTSRLFFAPLGSSLSPFEVCVLVGSNACLVTIADIFHETQRSHLSSSSSLLDHAMVINALATGRGGEAMALTLLQLLAEVCFPSSSSKKKKEAQRLNEDLIDLLNAPIDSTSLPSRGGNVGETLLHLAIRRNYLQLTQRLLAMGCDPTLRDGPAGEAGDSPLGISIALGHREITRALAKFYIRETRCARLISEICRRSLLRRNERYRQQQEGERTGGEDQ
jgi:ankyrin repeat protein